jgi:hypothetical protein
MMAIAGVGPAMAERLRVIFAEPVLDPSGKRTRQAPVGHNVKYVTPLHIASASHLPPDNPVRRMFARAAVEGYLCNRQSPFLASTKDTPSFATDLLREVGESVDSMVQANYKKYPGFVDPISGQIYHIGVSRY